MDKNVFSQLAAEFDRMERTITYQKEVISTMQKTPTCSCCKVPADGRIYTLPELPKMKLDDCSWAEIAMYAQSGMADKVFGQGDTKKFTLSNGTVMSARIIDFNHDTDKENNILPITFETVETLNDDFQMNPEYTNKGGWQNSQLRKVLNNSVTSLGGNSEKYGLTSDPLFVLSEQEIFGRKIYSHGGEGHWYGWYRQENTEYGKCKQNGERDWRWERSPLSGGTNNFCNVDGSGSAYSNSANYSYGVSFGFCV